MTSWCATKNDGTLSDRRIDAILGASKIYQVRWHAIVSSDIRGYQVCDTEYSATLSTVAPVPT
jgi:hypothetical protein